MMAPAMSLLARMDRLPVSRPHVGLLLIGGLGYTFDGMDAAIVAFLLPSMPATGVSSGAFGLVGAAGPFGFFFGAIRPEGSATGSAAEGHDVGPRGLHSDDAGAAAAPNFGLFLVFRVLAGLGTGAESVIIAPFISEFIPPKRRGLFIGSLAGFFSFGFVGAAVIGRFIVPLGDNGWRWAQVMTALPILLLLWWRRSLPESPRFLLGHGRVDEAERVVAALEERVRRATGAELRRSRPNRSEGHLRARAGQVTVWHPCGRGMRRTPP